MTPCIWNWPGGVVCPWRPWIKVCERWPRKQALNSSSSGDLRGRVLPVICTGRRRPEEKYLFEGLDERRKAGIIADGPRALVSWGLLRGITVGSKTTSSPRTKAREVRSYSGVLYEYRVERSWATRGATPVWVVAPGARRRVFYFAEVARGIVGRGQAGKPSQPAITTSRTTEASRAGRQRSPKVIE